MIVSNATPLIAFAHIGELTGSVPDLLIFSPSLVDTDEW
jgi:hypothetical protein